MAAGIRRRPGPGTESIAQGVFEYFIIDISSFEILIVIKFDAFQTGTVYSGESQDLGRQGSVRVKPVIFCHELNAGYVKILNRTGFFGCGLALDPDK